MKVRLTRITGGAEMPADVVLGDAPRPPRDGHPFVINIAGAESRTTTRVVEVLPLGAFVTEDGSRYVIEVLERAWRAMGLGRGGQGD